MLFAARVFRLLPPALARLLGFAGFVVRRALREERCVQVAASLAFTSLLSLVPLVTLALIVLSAKSGTRLLSKNSLMRAL
jgi:membrane protein